MDPRKRIVDYDRLHVEPAQIARAEAFVANEPELEKLDAEQRQSLVKQVAAMATAAEVYIFDRGEGALHINCQAYQTELGPRAVLLVAEKQGGVIDPLILWVQKSFLVEIGFSDAELIRLGFGPATEPEP